MRFDLSGQSVTEAVCATQRRALFCLNRVITSAVVVYRGATASVAVACGIGAFALTRICIDARGRNREARRAVGRYATADRIRSVIIAAETSTAVAALAVGVLITDFAVD